jgi:large subunit ribosomal protein L29
MVFEDLKNKSKEELAEMLNEKKEELRVLRFKASGHQLKQIHLMNTLKKEIAQISTLLKK